MRSIRDLGSRKREELEGVVGLRPVLPQIRSRSSGPHRFNRIYREHLPGSFGYMSWIAFLLFYIMWCWLYIPFKMITGTFASTRGLDIGLWESQPEQDMTPVRIHVESDGSMQVNGRALYHPERPTLCIQGSSLSTPTHVVLVMPANSDYQSFVTAVARVKERAWPEMCQLLFRTESVSAKPHN